MNIVRVRETIDLLRQLPKTARKKHRRFSYGTWDTLGIRRAFFIFPVECYTSACAGGEMVLHDSFRKQGLLGSYYGLNLRPSFEGATGSSALSRFLEISTGQADTAFISLHTKLNKARDSVTANDVADYLQEILDNESLKYHDQEGVSAVL